MTNFILEILPKCWNSIYLAGLPQLIARFVEYKNETISVLLNDALQLSEDWITTSSGGGANPSQKAQDLSENQKALKLKDNLKQIKANTATMQYTTCALNYDMKFYHDSLNSCVKIPTCLYERIPKHFILGTVNARTLQKDIRSTLEIWNNQVSKYIEQESWINNWEDEHNRSITIGRETIQSRYHYNINFLQTADKLNSDIDKIISALNRLKIEHRVLWGTIILPTIVVISPFLVAMIYRFVKFFNFLFLLISG